MFVNVRNDKGHCDCGGVHILKAMGSFTKFDCSLLCQIGAMFPAVITNRSRKNASEISEVEVKRYDRQDQEHSTATGY